MNSIDITINIRPIILCNILRPSLPKFFDKFFDTLKTKNVIIKTIIRVANNVNLSIVFLASEDSIIIEAIDPGPAINGIDNGVYAISFFSSASNSSLGVVLLLDLFDSIISKLIFKSNIPPAILKP